MSKKLSELADLETELAQHELDLATLQAELRAFEGIYLLITYRLPNEREDSGTFTDLPRPLGLVEGHMGN